MASDLFVVSSGALPDGARVMGFRGVEALSRPYSFEVYVALDRGRGDMVDLSDAVGARFTFAFRQVDLRPPFNFHGVVSQVELVNEWEGRTVFRFTVVPQLWQLGQSLHSRVFTKMALPAIISAILDENGLAAGEDYELRLSGSYATEEHVCQYKESDLAFLHRWMEREGLYYFFEHGDSQEKLVITDDKSSHEALVPFAVPFHPSTGDEAAKEALHAVGYRVRSLPAQVSFSDYDYAKPALEVRGSSQVSPSGLGEISLYGDRFFSPEQGKRLAEIRAEAFKASQQVLKGSGSARYLRSGYQFELSHHPRAQLNQSYLATEVQHLGRQVHGATELDALITDRAPDVYRVTVSAIPSEGQFRSDRVTPWPRIHCFENGVVDGPATSQYAQIDDQGRYAVKFKFDESSLKDGKGSTWVRMAQPHGGQVEGFHFPLRRGTEVLITFLGGDPDRPVIGAVLPNAATPSPITSGNNTKNVLQTGGASLIEIEDQAGLQYMKQYTPVSNAQLWMGTDANSPQGHNVELSSDGSGLSSFGTYFDAFVGSFKNEHVVGDVERAYDSNYMTNVLGNVIQTYGGNQTTTVTGNVNRTINGTLTEAVIGAVNQTYNSTFGLTVKADVTQNFDANHKLNITADDSIKVDGNATHTIEGGLTVTVNSGLSAHNANADYQLEVKANATMHATAEFSIRGDATAELSAPDTKVNGDTSVVVNGGSTVTIGPTAITINGSQIIKLSGPSKIEIVGGDITVSGGNVTVSASATLFERAGGTMTLSGNTAMIAGGPQLDLYAGVIKMNT